MYERILVPLDQSDLAERALPHAVAIARAFGSAIYLVSVVPIIDPVALKTTGQPMDWEAQVERAREYMRGVRKRLIADGIEAEWDVCQGDVAEELLRYAEVQECCLVVMSTHGRSGLGRWVYGSIADKILRHATAPVLLVRAADA